MFCHWVGTGYLFFNKLKHYQFISDDTTDSEQVDDKFLRMLWTQICRLCLQMTMLRCLAFTMFCVCGKIPLWKKRYWQPRSVVARKPDVTLSAVYCYQWCVCVCAETAAQAQDLVRSTNRTNMFNLGHACLCYEYEKLNWRDWNREILSCKTIVVKKDLVQRHLDLNCSSSKELYNTWRKLAISIPIHVNGSLHG